MSPVGHMQWRSKLGNVEIPTELYHNRARQTFLNLASYALVPFFSPYYVAVTHFRRRRMSEELCRNDLWPNTKSFFYKGFASTGL